jgi:hypothetical protein
MLGRQATALFKSKGSLLFCGPHRGGGAFAQLP